VLQIFVASPSDVRGEREALEHVVDSLNLSLSQTLSVRFELMSWETHANPGIGEDAQSVINRQVSADYDIFVGIMWGRFGSPTGRAGSGTEEEYDRALARRASEKNAMEIMLYFKDTPIPPSQVDPEQLARVFAFKKKASAQGVLYQSFVETAEFENGIRIHLTRVALDWRQKSGVTEIADSVIASNAKPTPANSEAENDDEPGYFDLIEASVDHLEEVNNVTERIGDATASLGNQITSRTTAIELLNKAGRGGDYKAIKRITNLAAGDMEQFVARMRLETPVFAEHYETAMTSFSQALSLYLQFANTRSDDPSEQKTLVEVAETMTSLREKMRGSHDSIAGLRSIVDSTPRMTSAFNRARRLTVAVLDEFLRELDSAIALTEDAENGVRALLKSEKPSG
jgi:hypothetical protein